MKTFALSVTCLFAVIARSGVAAEAVSMTSPLADCTIGSGMISVGSSGSGATLIA